MTWTSYKCHTKDTHVGHVQKQTTHNRSNNELIALLLQGMTQQ